MLKFFKEIDPEVVMLWSFAGLMASMTLASLAVVLFGIAAALGACS